MPACAVARSTEPTDSARNPGADAVVCAVRVSLPLIAPAPPSILRAEDDDRPSPRASPKPLSLLLTSCPVSLQDSAESAVFDANDDDIEFLMQVTAVSFSFLIAANPLQPRCKLAANSLQTRGVPLHSDILSFARTQTQQTVGAFAAFAALPCVRFARERTFFRTLSRRRSARSASSIAVSRFLMVPTCVQRSLLPESRVKALCDKGVHVYYFPVPCNLRDTMHA